MCYLYSNRHNEIVVVVVDISSTASDPIPLADRIVYSGSTCRTIRRTVLALQRHPERDQMTYDNRGISTRTRLKFRNMLDWPMPIFLPLGLLGHFETGRP